MRVVGLLALLAGCVILMLPIINKLLHRSLYVVEGTTIGGALLCLGIAALVLARITSPR